MLALSWWIADALIEWNCRGDDYLRMAAFHEFEELADRKIAGSAMPDHYYEHSHYVTFKDRRCILSVGQNRPLTEAEKREEMRVREQAGRRADYHAVLKKKYQWLAWFPWFPPRADAPPPP